MTHRPARKELVRHLILDHSVPPGSAARMTHAQASDRHVRLHAEFDAEPPRVAVRGALVRAAEAAWVTVGTVSGDAGVSPTSARSQLTKLVESGEAVTVKRKGRRYYRLVEEA